MRPTRQLFALALLFPSLAFAQPASQPADAIDPADPSAIRIDVNLDGASVQDYVNYLGDMTHGNFILLSDPNVDPSQIRLPPLRLRQMSLPSAVNLLTELPGTEITAEDDSSSTIPTYKIFVRMPEHATTVPGQQDPANKPVTRLFPLGRLLMPAGTDPNTPDAQKQLAERVAQALQLIDLTLSVQNAPGERATINLHGPTNTLIVKATPEQIGAIEEVLRALSPEPRPIILPAPPDGLLGPAARDGSGVDSQMAAVRAQVARMQAQAARMQAELAAARAAVAAQHPVPATQP